MGTSPNIYITLGNDTASISSLSGDLDSSISSEKTLKAIMHLRNSGGIASQVKLFMYQCSAAVSTSSAVKIVYNDTITTLNNGNKEVSFGTMSNGANKSFTCVLSCTSGFSPNTNYSFTLGVRAQYT